MARQPAKTAPKKPEKPPRDPVTLPEAAAFTSDVRTLAVNITILLAILIVIPVIVTQFWRDQVVIQPIAVPDAMLATGLTPEVAAGRLWDGLESIASSANTAKRTVISIPESTKVDFAIPDSGLSIDALVYYVRQFFNAYETRVQGEMRCGDAECTAAGQTMRLRVVGAGVDLIDLPPRGDLTEEDYFRKAAAEVMGYLDPFTALAAVSSTDPARGKVLARRLIRAKHPDAKWAYNLLGLLLQRENDLPGAEEQFRAALLLDANFSPALSNLGNVLRIKRDLAGSHAAYAKALAHDKADVFALSGSAQLAVDEGKIDEAIALLLRAAELRPVPPMFLDMAGSVMLGQNRDDEAIAYYKQALELDPGDQVALATLGFLYVNAEKYDDAERVYRAAAEFNPDDAEILGTHSAMLRSAHKFDEALERANQAIAIDPANPDYHQAASLALQDLARYDEALAERQEAQRLAPADADNLLALGDIYRLMGNKAAAIDAYTQFLTTAPPDEMMRPVAEMYIKLAGGTPPAAPTAEAPASAAPTQP